MANPTFEIAETGVESLTAREFITDLAIARDLSLQGLALAAKSRAELSGLVDTLMVGFGDGYSDGEIAASAISAAIDRQTANSTTAGAAGQVLDLSQRYGGRRAYIRPLVPQAMVEYASIRAPYHNPDPDMDNLSPWYSLSTRTRFDGRIERVFPDGTFRARSPHRLQARAGIRRDLVKMHPFNEDGGLQIELEFN